MLGQKDGQILVLLARQTILRHLKIESAEIISQEDLESAALKMKRGVFVTLKKQGELRGCIGSIAGTEPLVDGISRNAINAAFHDHRFPSLSSEEVDDLRINISILTEPEPLDYKNGNDLLAKLRTDIDGVILSASGGGRGATFLPQVWKQLPLPEDFLTHLCLKAGLDDDYWQKGNPDIQTYQAQYFEEI